MEQNGKIHTVLVLLELDNIGNQVMFVPFPKLSQ